VSNVLDIESIRMQGTARTPEQAIDEAGRLLVATGAVDEEYVRYMHEREASVSTYMGNYLAIPHGTNEAKETIRDSALSFIRYDEPIDWNGNEVRFVVGIAGKEGGHMEVLAGIATVFSDEDEVEKLLQASSREEVLELLSDVNG
jgi:PTS system mannitol-specific IIA component